MVLRRARLETWRRPHQEGDSLSKVKGRGKGQCKGPEAASLVDLKNQGGQGGCSCIGRV